MERNLKVVEIKMKSKGQGKKQGSAKFGSSTGSKRTASATNKGTDA